MTDNRPARGIKAEYTLDNAWLHARERLALLEGVADSGTISHLESIGVAPGWRCLEAGGGGGSIAAWLCRRVGPQGGVLAIDIDTRFLDALDEPNLEVRRHDIVDDPLPTGRFDLVHARALLVHLLTREQVLDRMAAALKPGGWLLVEEPDYCSKIPDPANDPAANKLFERIRSAEATWMAEAGIDQYYGRRLYGALRRRGLAGVAGEGRVPVAHGGSDLARFYRLTAEQSRERFLATGVTQHEFDTYLALHDDPEFVWQQGTIMAAWGRRPAA